MIAFVAIEAIALIIYRHRTGNGIPAGPLLVNIGAGGSLMLALRATLTDSGWQWIAAFLISALVFHVADLALRWQTQARR